MALSSRPTLAQQGAWVPSAIYTAKTIADLIAYGNARGVRVMPEVSINSSKTLVLF